MPGSAKYVVKEGAMTVPRGPTTFMSASIKVAGPPNRRPTARKDTWAITVSPASSPRLSRSLIRSVNPGTLGERSDESTRRTFDRVATGVLSVVEVMADHAGGIGDKFVAGTHTIDEE